MSKTFSALLTLSKQLEEKSAGLALECLHAATLLENSTDEEKACSNFLLGELLLKTAQEPIDAKQFFLASIDASQPSIKSDLSTRHYLLKSFEKLSALLPISESIELISNQLLQHSEDEILLSKLLFKFIEFFAECGPDRLEQVLSLFSSEAIENLRKKSEYFDILLTLSKALLILKNYCRAYEKLFHELLDETENKLKKTTIDQSRKAPMKIYLHCLRIINVLTWGIPDQSDRKTGKSLKIFHQEIIAFSQLEDAKIPENELDSFFWLKKEELTALGYLITVIHSVNYGNIDKAIKYSERTINQVSLHKSSFNENLRLVTLEYLAQCKLIIGDPLETVKIIGHLCSFVQNSQKMSKISQIHSLVGFLAMSVRRKETALRHFELALESNPENETYIQLCISLAKGAPLESGFSCDENIPLKAISFLISGYSQFNARDFDSAKRTLRDGVKISNAQDLKSLTAMFLLLLGEIFISASSDGYVTTVKQARQMATKIQHESSLIWANKLSCSVENSNEEDLPKIKEELAKLEAKIQADDESIRKSTLAQTLFDWTSITKLPNLAINEEPKSLVPEIQSSESSAPAPKSQNHALVDLEIDNMISKMEGGGAMMGPPIEKPPPSPLAQSISPRPVASPRPPPVVSPNLYASQPVNSPVQFNTQVPSPLSQPTTPHSPFQQVHSPMNPNSSPHQGMMQQAHFQNSHNSPSISPHHPAPSISPNMPNLQQNLQQQNVPQKQHMNVPAQNLNTGFSGAPPHNFGNGHLQSHPNPMQQVQMTQQNYNPFSHTNMVSAAPPNGAQQLAHVGNGHAMPIANQPAAMQSAFYPNMFPKNPPTNYPNHFQ